MGKIFLVAGPLGNLGDLSPRAAGVLREADYWFVEDSRVSGKLQTVLGVKKPMKVLNEHTSVDRLAKYVEELAKGNAAALLTDAGSPGISDPGSAMIDLCAQAGIEIDSIPGPSAVTNALSLSGFFAQRFCFLGFLPRKHGPLARELEPYADSSLSLVMFESPHRLAKVLECAGQVLGYRRYCVCREMTKLHQQVYRSTLPNIPTERDVPLKGEITIVIEGRRRNAG